VYVAFVCFILFAHVPGHKPIWLVFALITLGVAAWRYYFARTANVDTKYQDYRAIAEGLSVSLFWKLAGVTDNVASNYLREQRTELDWIRDGLRGWYVVFSPPAGSPAPGPGNSEKGIELAASHWVESQREYFARASRENHHHFERLERLANVAMGVTIALIALLMVLSFVPATAHYLYEHHWVTAAWIVAIDIILAAGALLHHYNERMAFFELGKQYTRMENIFSYVGRHLALAAKAHDVHAARAWLRALGKEALAENGHWVLLHRERPLELPHP
jgi:hypothetical protein